MTDDSIAALQAQIDSDVEKLVRILDDELSDLRAERDALNNRIRELVRRRLFYLGRQFGIEDEVSQTDARSRSPSKPAAILAYLQERPDETLRLYQIREALMERGWMKDTKRDRHALEVAARALAERGEITAPRRGFYRLVRPNRTLTVRAA